MAKVLLETSSKNCRFFGALTFSVIINQNKLIADDKLEQLLNDIIVTTCKLIQENFYGNLFIIKKLFSGLSLLYIYNSNRLSNPIRPFLKILTGTDDLQDSIIGFNEIQFSSLLTLQSILCEDITKKVVSSEFHDMFKENVFPDFEIVYKYLNSLHRDIPKSIMVLLLGNMSSLISYISFAENSSAVRYSDSSEPMMAFIFTNFQEFNFANIEEEMNLISNSISVMSDILETVPTLLSVGNYKNLLTETLFSKFGLDFINNIIMNENMRDTYEEEIEGFINLIINYLNLEIVKISKRILEPEIQHILEVVLTLTDMRGIAVLEESTSEQLLLFWEEFANVYVDNDDIYNMQFESNYDEFLEKRNKIFSRLSMTYWKKIQIPPVVEFESYKTEFLHYRLQVSDLFITLYSLLNISIYSQLCSQVISSLSDSSNGLQINEVEASLYLIHKITEDLIFYDESSAKEFHPFIQSIFENNLIGTVQRFPTTGLYKYVYSTAINFISSVYFIFQENNNLIGPAFNMLFTIILDVSNFENEGLTKKYDSLSLSASKAVLKICQQTRQKMVEFLPDFDRILENMIKSLNVDNLIRQRMANAYVSIVFSIIDPNKIGNVIKTLLNHIHNQIEECMTMSYNEVIEDYLISLLSCVHEIGKACQLPEELDDFLNENDQASINKYWKQDPLGIKSMILKIVENLSLNYYNTSQNSTICEKCCLILKCGISEPIDGPFQFSTEILRRYLVAKVNNCSINSIPFIYGLAETIIIVNFRHLDDSLIDGLINEIYVNKLDLIKSDPDLIKSSLDLFIIILEKKPILILHTSYFKEVVLKFALKSLESKETFIIRSACKFWVVFLTLKRGTLQDQMLINDLLVNQNLGYTLTSFALRSFIGTSRSNMDHYYLIFRNLVAKHSIECKEWLALSLVENNIDQYKNDKDRDFFIQKVVVTRGQRVLNDVLKTFWLQCNGFIDFNKVSY